MIAIRVKEYFNLAKHLAKPFVRSGRIEDSDAYSDALLGLVLAERRFETDKRTQFSTLAHRCIRNAIIDGVRQRARQAKIQYDDNQIDIPDLRQSPERACVLVGILLQDRPKRMEDYRNVNIAKEHYIDGVSWADIGRRLQVTKTCAMQYGQKGIEFLKDRLEHIDEC